MVEEILKFTKLTFLIHFICGIIFTIMFWIPSFASPLYGIRYSPEAAAMSMTIGSAFAGLTASSLFSLFAKTWKEVKIVVILENVWLFANLIASIINFNVFPLAMGVVTIIIGIVMLALFLVTFLQQQDKLKPLLK